MFWIGLLIVIIVLFLLANAWRIYLLAKYPDPVLADEVHTIPTRDQWSIKLFRVKSSENITRSEPVLLVHAAIFNRLSFLLPQGRSAASVLSRHGYDCWVLELRTTRSAGLPFDAHMNESTFESILTNDIPAALGYIRERTGFAKVHWVGHGLGGLLLYAYELLIGNEWIASGTTLGTPVGFRDATYERPAFSLFMCNYLRPLWNWIVRGKAPFARSLHAKPGLLPMNWDNIAADLDTGFFFTGIELSSYALLEQVDHWASTRTWKVRNEQDDLQSDLDTIETPLFVVVGAADPFVPIEAARLFFNNLPTEDKQLLILSKENKASADYGCLDLVLSPNSAEEVFEPIADWLEKHTITERKSRINDELVWKKPSSPETEESVATVEAEPPVSDSAEIAVADEQAAAIKIDESEPPAEKKTATKKAPVKKKTAAKKKAPAKRKTAAKKKTPAQAETAATLAEAEARAKESSDTSGTPAKKKATAKKKAPAKKKTAVTEPVAKKTPVRKKAVVKKAPAKKKPAATPSPEPSPTDEETTE